MYRFSHVEKFADVIGVRYQVLPYIYSEYMKAALQNTMMFNPLAFLYGEDALAGQVEDQLFIGENVMVAPVCEFLRERVKTAWEYRKKTVDTGSCRVIFGEADFLPGLVIDKFSDVLVVESLALGMVLLLWHEKQLTKSYKYIRNDYGLTTVLRLFLKRKL